MWFYREAESSSVVGPVDDDRLFELASSGELTACHEVRNSRQQTWKPADRERLIADAIRNRTAAAAVTATPAAPATIGSEASSPSDPRRGDSADAAAVTRVRAAPSDGSPPDWSKGVLADDDLPAASDETIDDAEAALRNAIDASEGTDESKLDESPEGDASPQAAPPGSEWRSLVHEALLRSKARDQSRGGREDRGRDGRAGVALGETFGRLLGTLRFVLIELPLLLVVLPFRLLFAKGDASGATSQTTTRKIRSTDQTRRADAVLRPLLRVGLAFLAGNAVLVGLLRFHNRESGRFPGLTDQPGRYHFPLLGEIGGGEFYFYLFDAVALAAVAGFLLAAYLESLAD